MWLRVAPVKADVSKERTASIIGVERTSELGTTLEVISIYSEYAQLLVTVNVIPSSNLSTLMTEAIRSFETLFLQQPRGVISRNSIWALTRLTLMSADTDSQMVCFNRNQIKPNDGGTLGTSECHH
jgi:hypothetical protein